MNTKTYIKTLAIAIASFTLSAVSTANPLPTVQGTQGDDVIDENWPGRADWGQAERINGLGGDDVIHGGGGDDLIYGGGGDDIIHGGAGNDTLYGDQGRDHLYGGPGNDTLYGGPHEDYLDGGDGANTLDGGTNTDLLIGRGGNDTLIGGSGDDYFVIIGNSLQGYTLYGNSATPGTGDTGSNLLLFARDVNPDNFMHKKVTKPNGDDYHFSELEFGLHTNEPVILDVPAEIAAGRMRQIHAFATGSANDVVTGTDYSGTDTYDARFHHTGTPMWVGELFFTHAGDDIINTGGGHDFVDAGAGNDTIDCPGGGQFHIITGPGSDTVRFYAADLTGPGNSGRTTIIYDLDSGDRLEVIGSATPDQFEKVDLSANDQVKTMIKFDNPNDNRDRKENEFLLLGVAASQVQIQSFAQGVLITAGPQLVPETQGPGKAPEKGPGRAPR